MKKFLLVFLFIFPTTAHGQTGEIIIHQDSSVTRMLKLYASFAKEKRQENGYRVQLTSNTNRQTLLVMKATFLQQYPNVPSYIQYTAPQFKLRVGDFNTKGEADAFCNEARIYFLSAFVVPDKIIIQGVQW